MWKFNGNTKIAPSHNKSGLEMKKHRTSLEPQCRQRFLRTQSIKHKRKKKLINWT